MDPLEHLHVARDDGVDLVQGDAGVVECRADRLVDHLGLVDVFAVARVPRLAETDDGDRAMFTRHDRFQNQGSSVLRFQNDHRVLLAGGSGCSMGEGTPGSFDLASARFAPQLQSGFGRASQTARGLRRTGESAAGRIHAGEVSL